MQQEEQQEAKPYKTDLISEELDYEVLENGDVKVTQNIKKEITWSSREFTSLLRQNEQALGMFKDAQSEETLKKMKDQEGEVQKVITTLKPFVVKSEIKQKAEYERLRHEGLLTNLKKGLEAKETNLAWFQTIWMRTKEELKKPVLAKLDAEENAKLLKIMQKLKRKGLK